MLTQQLYVVIVATVLAGDRKTSRILEDVCSETEWFKLCLPTDSLQRLQLGFVATEQQHWVLW